MLRPARLLLPCIAVLLAGCTSVTQPFPGIDPDRAWLALVAVAGTPDYSDLDPTRRWFLTENHVTADRENATIEIYRRVDRVLQRPGTRPVRQRRNWRFRIELESGAIPIATFTSRGLSVPAQAYEEAERYFAAVRRLLVGQQGDVVMRPYR